MELAAVRTPLLNWYSQTLSSVWLDLGMFPGTEHETRIIIFWTLRNEGRWRVHQNISQKQQLPSGSESYSSAEEQASADSTVYLTKVIGSVTFTSLRFIWFHGALSFSTYTEFKSPFAWCRADLLHQSTDFLLRDSGHSCRRVRRHPPAPQGRPDPAATRRVLMKSLLLDTSFQLTALRNAKGIKRAQFTYSKLPYSMNSDLKPLIWTCSRHV